jgi:predicted PurR-regulated permease PerM
MAVVLPNERSTPVEEAPLPPPRRAEHSVRPRSVLVVLGVTVGVLAVLTLGYLAWHAITWVLIAAFLAMALNPAVELFERRGLSRGIAGTAVFFIAFIAACGIGFLLIPPLVRETIAFVEGIPELIRQLDRGGGPLGFLERRFQLVDRAQKAIDDGGAAAVLGFGSPAIGVMKAVAATVLSVVAIAFLTFFMLLDGRRWVAAILDFVPAPARPRWERVFAGIYRTVGGYVSGNLLISLVAGVAAGVLLLALDVPYAVPLGLLVAIFDLIPLVGAALATLAVTAVAFTQGIVPGIVVLVVLILYQQFENNVLQPLVYGRCVALSPLAVLVSVLVGAELAGILGALAAIPVGGSIAVIAGELLRWRRESAIDVPTGTRLAEGAPGDTRETQKRQPRSG